MLEPAANACRMHTHAHKAEAIVIDTLQVDATNTCEDQTSEHEAMALIKRLYMPAHRQLARMNI